MKQRLLVMNGQRILQAESDGAWMTRKVEKAGALKPGIYNLYLAQAVEKTQSHEGVIVHADTFSVYQQVGRGFVTHVRSDFDRLPEVGSAQRISYSEQGKASIAAEAPKLARGRSL